MKALDASLSSQAKMQVDGQDHSMATLPSEQVYILVFGGIISLTQSLPGRILSPESGTICLSDWPGESSPARAKCGGSRTCSFC